MPLSRHFSSHRQGLLKGERARLPFSVKGTALRAVLGRVAMIGFFGWLPWQHGGRWSVAMIGFFGRGHVTNQRAKGNLSTTKLIFFPHSNFIFAL